MNLPDKPVDRTIGEPYAGGHFYDSDKGGNLHMKTTKALTLPADAQLSAMVTYSIEVGYDYAERFPYTVLGTAAADGGLYIPQGATPPPLGDLVADPGNV